jgi:hypothetical protein
METYNSVIQINPQTSGANVSTAIASTGHVHAYFAPLQDAFYPCNITKHNTSSSISVNALNANLRTNYQQTPTTHPYLLTYHRLPRWTTLSSFSRCRPRAWITPLLRLMRTSTTLLEIGKWGHREVWFNRLWTISEIKVFTRQRYTAVIDMF